MDSQVSPSGYTGRNEILLSLTESVLNDLLPSMQAVSLVFQQVLYEPGETIDHVYFPEAGIVCLTADTHDSGLVEVGMIGWEGVAGVSVTLNKDAVSMHKVIVQVQGVAIRMRTAAFLEALDRCAAFRDRCLKYCQLLILQASQSAACNARHELTERLARWLLTSRDRIDSDEMPVTQEFMALMLGVRRSGVSLIANTLQSTGSIRQARGRITILDRQALESEACNCYSFIERHRRMIIKCE